MPENAGCPDPNNSSFLIKFQYVKICLKLENNWCGDETSRGSPRY